MSTETDLLGLPTAPAGIVAPPVPRGLAQVEIVVPVYNEARGLEAGVRRLHAYLGERFPFDWRITIADNGSVDGTAAVADHLATAFPGVAVVHLDQKGRGPALRGAAGRLGCRPGFAGRHRAHRPRRPAGGVAPPPPPPHPHPGRGECRPCPPTDPLRRRRGGVRAPDHPGRPGPLGARPLTAPVVPSPLPPSPPTAPLAAPADSPSLPVPAVGPAAGPATPGVAGPTGALARRLGFAGPVLVAVVLNCWGLSGSGLGNTYYAAAVRAMTRSWGNFFFGAFDPGGFITVDKPPMALWFQAASAKIFRFSSLSLLLPRALARAASLALLWA